MSAAAPLTRRGPADVTVAIVSHRHYRFLEPCLTALFRHTAARLDVAIVDNVGEPQIAALLRARFPQTRLIVNLRALGFAANNNQVILDTPARYAMLLNPDTEVQPGAIDRLVEHLERHPQVGACGPKLVYPDGRLQLSCRRFPTVGAVLVRRTPLRVFLRGSRVAREYVMADEAHDASRPVDWLFGAAILMRRECLRAVGGLDDRMFMYCEDADWCLRCRQGGWEIHYVPAAVITHHLDDGKYNGFFTRHRFMHYRSMCRYAWKHWRSCLRWNPGILEHEVGRFASAPPVALAERTQALHDT
jgi:GT2 family glycosyltransferase